MYDYRSRFVHGEIPFPNNFYEADGPSEYIDFFLKSNESVQLATAILFSTLQQLAKKGWHSLDFKYSLKKPKAV